MHRIVRVTDFSLVGPLSIQVGFDDGSVQIIDFEPVLHGDLFGPLRDPVFFARVGLDPEVHTLVWPNGADFDPATLHDWPARVAELTELARGWSKGER